MNGVLYYRKGKILEITNKNSFSFNPSVGSRKTIIKAISFYSSIPVVCLTPCFFIEVTEVDDHEI